MENVNDSTLDFYLRGRGGELAYRLALEEMWRRAQPDESEMVSELRRRGYVVFKPRTGKKKCTLDGTK